MNIIIIHYKLHKKCVDGFFCVFIYFLYFFDFLRILNDIQVIDEEEGCQVHGISQRRSRSLSKWTRNRWKRKRGDCSTLCRSHLICFLRLQRWFRVFSRDFRYKIHKLIYAIFCFVEPLQQRLFCWLCMTIWILAGNSWNFPRFVSAPPPRRRSHLRHKLIWLVCVKLLAPILDLFQVAFVIPNSRAIHRILQEPGHSSCLAIRNADVPRIIHMRRHARVGNASRLEL